MIKKATASLMLLLCFYSCGKQEASTVTPEPKYEYDSNSEQYSKSSDTLTQYENPTAKEVTEYPKLTNIQKYSQVKINQGLIIECKTTVEFVNGETDNIKIKMQIPHEEPNTINLINPIKIADESPEVTSKIYTDDAGEKVIFLWRKDMSKISMINGDNTVMFLR
jgi:hypothetical protein